MKMLVAGVVALSLCAGCTNAAPQGEAPRGEAMVAAADPLAVEAGLEMLRRGGSAIDAAIAVELTLGLVEPESSGVGGGGFLIHYRASDEAIDAFDGREWAPAGATPDMFLVDGKPLPFELAQASGKSIGTPALVPMLKMAHAEHGKLTWATLFEPAIKLAEDGFVVGPRLSRSLLNNKAIFEADAQAGAIVEALVEVAHQWRKPTLGIRLGSRSPGPPRRYRQNHRRDAKQRRGLLTHKIQHILRFLRVQKINFVDHQDDFALPFVEHRQKSPLGFAKGSVG